MIIKKLFKLISTIVLAVLVATLVRTLLIQIYYIPSTSMEPTLKIDDRVLVVKDTIVQLDIASGDIVVFYNNDSEHSISFFQEYIDGLQIWKISDINSQENTAIIKRVVGVGGDTVEILENGEVFVNNSKFTIFNIDEGVNFKRETFLIPENEIFVLGDNRPNSQDSRYIGTIPMRNIIGKATHLIYPLENFKKLDD
ncbi:signal peptidase I [archaeon]|nr:signal peptidase I [bacterium]NDB79802.1 signal peptidase I [archaeon]